MSRYREASTEAEATHAGSEPVNNSTGQQRQRILNYLQRGNRLTTLCARESLGIMHPAARVMELRKTGYNIVTNIRTGPDVTGTRHSVAEYVLLSGSEVQS